MGYVSQNAIRTICAGLPSLYVPRPEEDFLRYAVAALPRIVAADISVFDEFRKNSVPRQILWPDGVDAHMSNSQSVLARFAHEHPILKHIRRTGDTQPVRISDFVTRRQYRNLGIYSELFRPFNVESQVAFSLNSGRAKIIGVALCRSGKDFNENERQTLRLLQPHFARAWRNARTLSQMLGKRTRLEDLLDDAGDAVVVARPDGKIEWLSRVAAELFQRRFGQVGRSLPEAFRFGPVRARLPGESGAPASATPVQYVLPLANARLAVMEVPLGPLRLLAIDERGARHDRPDLPLFGLTRREAEVLDWVTLGKTNAEIASILGSKPLTVKKHLEHVYAKLDVTSRTAATALVLRAGGAKRLERDAALRPGRA